MADVQNESLVKHVQNEQSGNDNNACRKMPFQSQVLIFPAEVMSVQMLHRDGKSRFVRSDGMGELPQGPLDENEHGIGVVLNEAYGGFNPPTQINDKGLHLLQQRGKQVARNMSRVDPDLVFLVESDQIIPAGLGHTCNELVVRRIPREIVEAGSYRIHEYDGKEFLVADLDAQVRPPAQVP